MAINRFVTRKGWRAAKPRRVDKLARNAVDTIVLHYTAADADERALHRNCAKRVRGVQRFHQQSRGWNDIAYNFLVCKHGYWFRGRGNGVRSAATGKANRHTMAICFLGNDTANRDDVTNAGRDGIRRAIRSIRRYHPRARKIRGHRDFTATACPGDQLYAWLQTLR
jgi:hypothetical protein